MGRIVLILFLCINELYEEYFLSVKHPDFVYNIDFL